MGSHYYLPYTNGAMMARFLRMRPGSHHDSPRWGPRWPQSRCRSDLFSASNCVCMGWMGFNGTQKHWDGQNMSKFKKSMELIWWSLMRLLKLIHIGLVKQRAICWCTHTGDLMDCCCVSDPGGSTQILQRSHKAPWLFRHLSAPDLAVGKLTVCYWTWPFSSLIFPW